MKTRKRRIRDYNCWLCGRTMAINVPPYQRHNWSICTCEKEGRPGGGCAPYGLSAEEIERAKIKYRSETALNVTDNGGQKSS